MRPAAGLASTLHPAGCRRAWMQARARRWDLDDSYCELPRRPPHLLLAAAVLLLRSSSSLYVWLPTPPSSDLPRCGRSPKKALLATRGT